MKLIYGFLCHFGLNGLIPVTKTTRSKRAGFCRESEKPPTGSVLSWIFISLIVSGCGGSSKECDYYNKLKKGKAGNITADGNQAIGSVQDEIIACGFGNKACVDMAVENFGKAHNCNQ